MEYKRYKKDYSVLTKIPWIASMRIVQKALSEEVIDKNTYFKLEKFIDMEYGDK